MNEVELEKVTNWVRMAAPEYLADVKPDMVTDAPESKAVRLRWFALKLGPHTYTVGVNIHYGGNLGGLWVKNQGTEDAVEFHPHAPPTHGLPSATRNALRNHLLNSTHKPTYALHHKTK
jgi:hypothetical protein